MKTLLDALLDRGLAVHEEAVYTAAEMEDPDNCMVIVKRDYLGRPVEQKHVIPGHFYYGLDLTILRTLVSRTNWEWWLKRWGDRPEVIVVDYDYDCLVRAGWMDWQPPWARDSTLNRVFVDLTAPMQDAEAALLVADYKEWLDAMLDARPIDMEAYNNDRDGVIRVLWEVERDDPIDFLAALIDAILDEMGLDREDADARAFVETALGGGTDPDAPVSRMSRRWPMNLRQMYEDAGGDYRIEPDDSLSEMSWDEIDKGGADKLEPDPVAKFLYDDDVVDGVMTDPQVRAVYSTSSGVAVNRGSGWDRDAHET